MRKHAFTILITLLAAGALFSQGPSRISNPAKAGGVSSVFARAGAVLAQVGDYTCAQVTNCVPNTTTVAGHPLSSNVNVTASDVGLASVTNDAQTKAAVVPNTAPSAGQILAGNAGGTAYAPVSVSGDGTLSSTGAFALATTLTPGSCGDATHSCGLNYDAKGRLTGASNNVITGTVQTIQLTSQYTNSTNGFTNVAGGNTLAFTAAANTNYTATCHLYYQAATTSGGLNIEWTGPSSPTSVVYGLWLPKSSSTISTGAQTAYSGGLGSAASTATTNFDAVLSFALQNGSNAGTVNLLAASISNGVQLTIQKGSYCVVTTN